MNVSHEFRFSNRQVGVELEIPEYAETLEALVKDHCWDMKSDASIPEEGVEAVTPPIYGDAIHAQITRFYTICEEAGVSTEHSSCGTHVHVNAKDIYSFIDQSPQKDELEDRVHKWGMAIAALSRLFVGPGRNSTRFAAGGFAIRDNCDDPLVLKKLRRIDYPTVAIRYNTFEFRIFPSTTNVSYTLARAAFAQAAVDWIYKHLKLTANTFRRRLAVISAPLDSEEAFTNADTVRASLVELGVNPAAIEVLMGIYAKFLPGNRVKLPAIWDEERNRVLALELMRSAYCDDFRVSFDRYNTPVPLVEYLARELSIPELEPTTTTV
jgi:hypothetical protein